MVRSRFRMEARERLGLSLASGSCSGLLNFPSWGASRRFQSFGGGHRVEPKLLKALVRNFH